MNKDERLEMRLTITEKEALRRMAQVDCRKVSEWIREMIRKEAHARGLWPGQEGEHVQRTV